ncbi:YeeE/YedE family protein [Methylobacterium sp. P5_C11]
MEGFTPVSAILGGAMIGASASLLLLLNGRIAGISGILGGLLARPSRETGWRAAFVAGLVLAPFAYAGLGGSLPPVKVGVSFPLLILAGLLVGFGARLGAGCTSGHGVCGIGRGSPRSLAATGTFLAVAVLTVLVVRHLVGA